MEKDFRAEIGALVQDRKQAYTAMSDRIWGFAEPRFQEYDSSRLQQEYLKARGFSIRADLAGEETAFIAEYGSGKPVLAFLGEFDALSSLEQEADSTERPWLRPPSSWNGGSGSSGRFKNLYGVPWTSGHHPVLRLSGRGKCRRKGVSGAGRLF